MSFKLLIFVTIVAGVSSLPLYDFYHSVSDPHTGYIKSQSESRKGDAVSGRYEVINSDGHKRVVEYTADDHNGFHGVHCCELSSVKIPVHVAKVIAPAVHYVQSVHHDANVLTPVTNIVPAQVSFKTPVINYHY